jgi:hypothetical protein
LVKAAPKLANDFQIKFSEAALKHMMNPKRSVPIQILWEAIKAGNMGPDPKGSSAAKMFYSEMYRGNIKYNLEVLYDI